MPGSWRYCGKVCSAARLCHIKVHHRIPVMVRSADVNAGCIADSQVKADSSCIVHVHVEPRLEVVSVALGAPVCLVPELLDKHMLVFDCTLQKSLDTHSEGFHSADRL